MLALVLFAFGCKSQPAPAPDAGELPPWLAQGKQSWGDADTGFYGIGTGSPEVADELQRVTIASEQARGAVQQRFEAWFVEWLKARSILLPETKTVEGTAEHALATAPTRAEASIRIIERYTGPDGRMFALAHLSADFMRSEPF